jgi:deoxyribodipyrimidine photolyase-like uncharacterized protein
VSGKQSLARVPGGRLLLLPGSHLFPIDYLSNLRDATIFMAEDMGLCTSCRHHKQKIVMFLAAMRSHADGLFWNRIARYRDRLKANPRMANIALSLDRIESVRRARSEAAGTELQERLTADR